MILDTNVSDKQCVFLVDTQADISVLKQQSVNELAKIDEDDIINIKGVTNGVTSSLGTVDIDLKHDSYLIPQIFHIVPNDFNIGADGILGKDFLKHYESNISYRKMTLTLYNNDKIIKIPLYDGPNSDTFVLPARCEVARRIKLLKHATGPQLVDAQEIAKGVMIARTIVDSDSPIVRIINTTSKVQILTLKSVKSESLDNYKIYTIDEVKTKKERTKLLLTEISKNVPTHYKERILPLCNEFSDIFALESDKMTVNNFYTQSFRVKDETPVYVKNYRLPFSQRDEIASQVEKLLKNDLIEPSCAEYNSPILLVPKKSNDKTKKWRLCIDYRLVNRKLVADKYPLPRIEDVLDSLGRAKHFSIIDLFSGFHQIPISEESRDITSFSTPDGSFRWTVVPFGLNVSPNSFARMMAIAFSGIPSGTAFLYIDDIIVIGCSEEHHMRNLRKVFETLRKYNLKINPYKCSFFKKEVVFLGHKCSENGISPGNDKLKSIHEYPRPNDKESTKRFVAFANFYRKFIKNFAIMAQPLNQLTRKSTIFKWSDVHENAFLSIKNSLTEPSILAYPDLQKQFILTTDACLNGCGAVLSQIQDDGTERPISFSSRSFNKYERNKPIIELELLAIFYAIMHFKPYIYGTNFLVRTDHKPLVYLFSLKNPSQRLLRIRLELEEYKFDIEYIKGSQNVVADALSRMSFDEIRDCNQNAAQVCVTTRSMNKKQSSENETKKIKDNENDKLTIMNVYEDNNYSFTRKIPKLVITKNVLQARINRKIVFEFNLCNTARDEKLSLGKFFSQLQMKASEHKMCLFQLPIDSTIFEKCAIEEFKIVGQKMLNNVKIVLTPAIKCIKNEQERRDILESFHCHELNGGHCGRNKLYAKIRSKYFWKGMSKDIVNLVRKCEKCQFNKITVHTKEKMKITYTPQKAFDVVIVDTIGPIKRFGTVNEYAVTIICDLTKHLTIIPIPNGLAQTVAKAIFENFILTFGVMKTIRTDLGTEYNCDLFKELSRLLKFKHDFSTSYHHESVGTIERNHRVLNAYLRSYLLDSGDSWDVYAKYFEFCYNTTPNSVHTYTPFELVFGRIANLPVDTFDRIEPIYNTDNYVKELKYRLQVTNQKAREILMKYKQKMKELYDRNANEISLNIGDKIKIRDFSKHKLESMYRGPYIVKEIIDENVVAEALDTQKKVTVHKNRVKKM